MEYFITNMHLFTINLKTIKITGLYGITIHLAFIYVRGSVFLWHTHSLVDPFNNPERINAVLIWIRFHPPLVNRGRINL